MGLTEQNEIESLKQEIVELQSQLAFQEDTMQALNSVVIRQQQQIENLHELFQQQKSQLETMSEERGAADQTIEERPPHY